MSLDSTMDVLLDAARDHLRATLALAPEECDVTPDGRPNPASGNRFVAVHPGNVQNTQKHCLDERYAFKVTVTVRTSPYPRDRKRDGGAWALALQVRAAIHMSYTLTALAIAANADVQFTVPPVFESGVYLGPQTAEWFWAEGQEPDPTGIAVELSFGSAERITYINEAEE